MRRGEYSAPPNAPVRSEQRDRTPVTGLEGLGHTIRPPTRVWYNGYYNYIYSYFDDCVENLEIKAYLVFKVVQFLSP